MKPLRISDAQLAAIREDSTYLYQKTGKELAGWILQLLAEHEADKKWIQAITKAHAQGCSAECSVCAGPGERQ